MINKNDVPEKIWMSRQTAVNIDRTTPVLLWVTNDETNKGTDIEYILKSVVDKSELKLRDRIKQLGG